MPERQEMRDAGIQEIPEGDMSAKSQEDYLNVAENMGYTIDFQTGEWRTYQKYNKGRLISESEFRKLEPYLNETDYGKALLYIESKNHLSNYDKF